MQAKELMRQEKESEKIEEIFIKFKLGANRKNGDG
jgi:hypothetical protein